MVRVHETRIDEPPVGLRDHCPFGKRAVRQSLADRLDRRPFDQDVDVTLDGRTVTVIRQDRGAVPEEMTGHGKRRPKGIAKLSLRIEGFQRDESLWQFFRAEP